jgi:hypothetical protein
MRTVDETFYLRGTDCLARQIDTPSLAFDKAYDFEPAVTRVVASAVGFRHCMLKICVDVPISIA